MCVELVLIGVIWVVINVVNLVLVLVVVDDMFGGCCVDFVVGLVVWLGVLIDYVCFVFVG